MKSNSLAWILLGGCLFALTATELAACSSDNGGNGFPSQPNEDSGEEDEDGSTKSDGGKSDGGKSDGGGGGDGGEEKECGTMPTLHPKPTDDAGDPIMNFFCPFSSPSGQKPEYCESGEEHCCVSYTQGVLSVCAASCPEEADGGPFNGRDIQCLDPQDCPGGGQVCCGSGTVLEDPDCHNFFGKGFKGTRCAASCDTANGEYVVCQSNDQCDDGKTCQAMSAAGAQFGHCM